MEKIAKGYNELWAWFGLSYANFLTLPRVLMHEMPEEWQERMALLLKEYNDEFPNHPDIGITCRATKDGKLTKFPSWILNYRYPDSAEINKLRKKPMTDK